MTDLDYIVHLLTNKCFAEAAYFASVGAAKAPSSLSHLLAGSACCGCAEPLAIAQRLLEGAPVPDEIGAGGLRVSPATDLPYEGFFHLIESLRLDSSIQPTPDLCQVFDDIADNLAYVSRRELHRGIARRHRYTMREVTVSAAILLRRWTGSGRELPGVMKPLLDLGAEIIESELHRLGGDADFFLAAP